MRDVIDQLVRAQSKEEVVETLAQYLGRLHRAGAIRQLPKSCRYLEVKDIYDIHDWYRQLKTESEQANAPHNFWLREVTDVYQVALDRLNAMGWFSLDAATRT
jgi:uncharacterized cysteine cluster protein YcgN (CxxCxxCC family)